LTRPWVAGCLGILEAEENVLNGGDDGGVDNGEESSKKLGSESQEVMLGGEEGNGGAFGLG